MLDFKTLSNISKTCHRGAAVVKSVKQYHEVMEYAPKALVALARTRLIRHFSAASVHAALLSAACISCGSYGVFLFLPTCQRCCNHCLLKNTSLWVEEISIVKESFGLSAAAVKNVPIMTSLPGQYGLHKLYNFTEQLELVCVGTAKRLALEGGRSKECMKQELDARLEAGLPRDKYHYQLHLQKAPLNQLNPKTVAQRPRAQSLRNKFYGLAAIPVPYVVPGSHVENGLWCRGCTRSPFWNFPISPEMSWYQLRSHSRERLLIARSRSDLLKHFEECSRAKFLFCIPKESQDRFRNLFV